MLTKPGHHKGKDRTKRNTPVPVSTKIAHRMLMTTTRTVVVIKFAVVSFAISCGSNIANSVLLKQVEWEARSGILLATPMPIQVHVYSAACYQYYLWSVNSTTNRLSKCESNANANAMRSLLNIPIPNSSSPLPSFPTRSCWSWVRASAILFVGLDIYIAKKTTENDSRDSIRC